MSIQEAYDPTFVTPIKPKHNWRILSDEYLNLSKEVTNQIFDDVGGLFPLDDATVQELEGFSPALIARSENTTKWRN